MALKGHKQFEWQSEVSGNWLKTHTVASDKNHRIYHDLPSPEWTRHDGEDWKGDKDAVIEEAMFGDGEVSSNKNKGVSYWSAGGVSNFNHENPEYRIYAYKLAKPSISIPEGFTKWDGGECPVEKVSDVEVIFRAPPHIPYQHCGERLRWDHQGIGGDIVAYRVTALAAVKGVTL
jgi:hypothetical protein